MKALMLTCGLLASSMAFTQTPDAADPTGLPGDDLSLGGALDLFKRSKDLQSFEEALNQPDNKVNNLDLDQDGQVDYIRVLDDRDGDTHAIVLQVPVNKSESQDVAVIELEKTGKANAVVQIVGDEDLYGTDAIVEPYDQDEKGKAGKGPTPVELVPAVVVVNVWAWPCVTWIYGPSYTVWNSPWYWGYYPGWWRPWRPHPWRVWWGWNAHYVTYYHPVHVRRVVVAQRIYAPRRTRSAVVMERTRTIQRTRVAPAQRAAPAPRSAPQGRPERQERTAPAKAPRPTRDVRRQQRQQQRMDRKQQRGKRPR